MKKILLILTIIIFSFASKLQDISKSLTPWGPLNIEIKHRNLIITTKERRVTDTIFLAMITDGLCMNYYFNKHLLDGISKITILNKFNYHGYVLEGGADVCAQIGKMKNNNNIKFFILSKTHLY